MPDDKAASKKKGTRTAVIVGVVALVAGVGYFWIKNRQGGSSSASGTDTTGGVTGSGFTDMGDIIQTVQGPPGKTGATGKTGKTGARGKAGPAGKDDDKPARKTWKRKTGAKVPAGRQG